MSRYNHIFEEIEKCKPKSILEIGTWDGRHSAQMINTAAKYIPKDDIVYYGFDLWELLSETEYYAEYLHPKQPAKKKQAEKLLNKTGVEYHLYQGNTKETLPLFTPPEPIDFVWIDGGHSLTTIRSDWMNIQRIIHLESVVLFDDYLSDNKKVGCYEVIMEILDTERFDVWILPTIDKNAAGETNQIVKVQHIHEQI